MKMSFRWYGDSDPVSLAYIRQIPGIHGIVSAVYDVPVGETWPLDKIIALKECQNVMLDGFSLTGMYYRGAGHLETDQSVYALQQKLIGRYGVLDPTDGSRSERFSLSGHFGAEG